MLPPSQRCWVTAKTLSHRETQAKVPPCLLRRFSARASKQNQQKHHANQPGSGESALRRSQRRDREPRGEPTSPQLEGCSPSRHRTSTDAKIQHLMHGSGDGICSSRTSLPSARRPHASLSTHKLLAADNQLRMSN